MKQIRNGILAFVVTVSMFSLIAFAAFTFDHDGGGNWFGPSSPHGTQDNVVVTFDDSFAGYSCPSAIPPAPVPGPYTT